MRKIQTKDKSFSCFVLKNKNKLLWCSDPYQIKKYNNTLEFESSLAEIKLSNFFKHPVVIHLPYSCNHQSPIYFIEYSSYKTKNVVLGDYRLDNLKGIYLEYDDYLRMFNQAQEFLKRGESYQINLTHVFEFFYTSNIQPTNFVMAFLSDLSKVGAYAHATYIAEDNLLILSNSPECLIQKSENDYLYSMPIKGTIKDTFENEYKLRESQKDQAELFMITDLIRNDLTVITKNASTVVSAKNILRVPGLIHQYSVVASKLSSEVSLLGLVKGVFPGGSITGAPKINTMKFIKSLEKTNRGYYCGSTFLLFGNSISSSINIRTATFDLAANRFLYGAGGGITIKSRADDEFEEMTRKLHSFIDLFA